MGKVQSKGSRIGCTPAARQAKLRPHDASMAKLDKASAYEAGDCRFESCSERQIPPATGITSLSING